MIVHTLGLVLLENYFYLKGEWCRSCIKKKWARKKEKQRCQRLLVRHSLNTFVKLAERKRGRVISKQYENTDGYFWLECEKGHKFRKQGKKLLKGEWCPYCSGRKIYENPIGHLSKLAAAKGGEFLSENYAKANDKYLWECERGHKWEATYTNVKRGTWCPWCSGRELDFEKINRVIEERGGQLISQQVKGAKERILVRCLHNHRFSTCWNAISNGNWCPKCYVSVGEEICRQFFEKFFKVKFPTSYPDWLNYKDRQLELDGYNSKLQVAFEHHGNQHLHFVSHFHKDEGELKSQQLRDRSKMRLCKKYGVTLIVIENITKFTTVEEVTHHILKKLRLSGMTKKIKTKIRLNFNEVYKVSKIRPDLTFLETYKIHLLSPIYKGARKKHIWQCGKNHEFYYTQDVLKNRVKRGLNPCPICHKKD